ncbi:ras-related protein Rab-37-like [Ischnura elegans]|uniref:ras-related protein Rab-37-like n=1 Tax=Ischnura elegans TaxID=197161 RepID=UPI001ED8A8C2|nr:ras-related protein Rab-37-like [Ischnura elegans]
MATAVEDVLSDDVFESPEEIGYESPDHGKEASSQGQQQPWETGQRKKVPVFTVGLRSISKDFEDDYDEDESVFVDSEADRLSPGRSEALANMTPSPTGYKGYQPPADIIQLHDHGVSNGQSWRETRERPVHKTILLGDSGVGKTSLLVQFDTGKFQTGTFSATVGIGFTNKVVTVDGKSIKLQIWDTAGQERFRSVTHAYYRDAHALLLLYDVTNKTSFDNIRAWLGEIREYASDDVAIMLIGNKADCSAEERAVSGENGSRVASEYGVSFVETSAKTGLNVDAAFMSVARRLCSLDDEIRTPEEGPTGTSAGHPNGVSADNSAPFSLQDYVREQASRGSCAACNA